MQSHEPENRIVFNLEATQEHPRSSEGAMLTLKSGRIIYLYTQFYGGDRDHSSARIVKIHSDDQGRTWSPSPQVVVERGEAQNVMSVSLLRLKSGKLGLFYLIKLSNDDCRPWVRFSNDDAQTWSQPRPVISRPGYYVMNNDRVLQHYTGRLIAPVAWHRCQDDGKHDSRSAVFWFFSDDEGLTWRESQTWHTIPVKDSGAGLQEPGVVEWFDGSLYSWARTDAGAQFGFRSTDHGQTWSAPEPTPLRSPLGPASIKMVVSCPSWLALYNDHSGAFPFTPGRRTPLVAAISEDGGRSWPLKKLVENDPDGAFHYTAIHFTDDEAVLLAYCAGDKHIGWLNRLRIRRIALNWLFV